MKVKELEQTVGGLSKPSKMPGFAYGIPAWECKIGSLLRKIKGSVCCGCYALKGMYVFPVVKAAQVRRLESISDSKWVKNMSALLTFKYRNKTGIDRVFRWHDAGDLQSVAHLEKIVQVAKNIPDLSFWLPTRERAMLKEYISTGKKFPANLTVRVSEAMIGRSPSLSDTILDTVASAVDAGKGFQCKAPSQNGECLTCRACWDKTVPLVDYHKH